MISTIIVTYNRKQYLERCLNAVLAQTRLPEALYIIDNASTDGTPEMLKDKGYLANSRIKYVRLEHNSGGSGGFYEGMKRAYDDGAEWLWIMDDDGFPEQHCLEALLKHKEKADILCSLCVSDTDPAKLSFGVTDPKIEEEYTTVAESQAKSKDGILDFVGNAFNSLLIKRSVCQKSGFPDPRLFMRGDEFEYYARCAHNGTKAITVIDSVHYHPDNRLAVERIFFGKYHVLFCNIEKLDYLMFRNTLYTLKKYYGPAVVVKYIVKHFWYFLVNRRCDLKHLWLFIRAARAGLAERF